MKKIFQFIIVFMTIVSATGCSDEDSVIQSLSVPESRVGTIYHTVKPDTLPTITSSQAMEIAVSIASSNSTSRSSRVAEYVETISDNDDNPLMYIVNYTDNHGFVIVSASKSYGPILAQSNEGRFSLTDLNFNHPVNLWLEEQKYIISHSYDLSDSIRSAAASDWMQYNFAHTEPLTISYTPDKPQVYYDSLMRWSRDPNIEVYRYEDYKNTDEYRFLSDDEKRYITTSIQAFGNSNYGSAESSTLVTRQFIVKTFESQLLSTTWHQGSPFNGKVPGSKYLGCAAVAAGQIMKYHKHPSNFNWANMPNSGATATTQEFLYELGTNIGIDYNAELSSTKLNKVKNALEKYGYIVTEKSTHDISSVITELSKRRPVYMRGTWKKENGETVGHAWVCDGHFYREMHNEIRFMTLDYRPTIYSTPDLMIEAYTIRKDPASYVQYHFNWGSNDTSINGYYSDSNISFKFDNEIHNYNNKRQELLIQPKR